MDRRDRSGWKRPTRTLLAWVLIGAMLAGCGGGGSSGNSTGAGSGGVTVTTGLQGLKAAQMSDGSVYYTGSYQGQPLNVVHQGVAGAGTWAAYAGSGTERLRYTLSDTAGLQEVVAVNTGERMTVQTVGQERVEYRSYSSTGAFEFGAVLWQVNQRWLMARMQTEDFRGYGDLVGPLDVTDTITVGLTATAAGVATHPGVMAAGLNHRMPQGLLGSMAWSDLRRAGFIALKTVATCVFTGAMVAATISGAPVFGTAVFIAGVWKTAQGYEALAPFFTKASTASSDPVVDSQPAPDVVADYQTQTQPTTYTAQPAPLAPPPSVPDPVITGVTPTTATVNQPVTLTVSGTGLDGYYGMAMTLPGCANLQQLSKSATANTFSCTPQAVGAMAGTVQDPISKAVLSTFSVTVTDKPTTGFTKIALDGTALPDTAPTWACVRHNATGLLWEAHVTRQTPPHPCAWGPAFTCTGGYTNFGNSRPYVSYDASVVTGSVCGKPGRLPTVDEGTALVNDPAYAAANPTPGAFMTTWFGADDIAWTGWTSSPVAGFPSFAWYVDFSSGSIYDADLSGRFLDYYGYGVRLVAGP
jgi:hypothetical protein